MSEQPMGATWPEQNAVEEWWRTHSFELKKGVTDYRLELQRELEAARDDCRRFVAENYRMRDVLIDYREALLRDIEDTPLGDDLRPAMEEELARVDKALVPEK